MSPLGVFGGTFDPVHLGHLRAAENACAALGLEQVVFVPAQCPPHRASPQGTALDRFAMVALATADNPCFVASDIELQRAGTSYTVDTLAALSEAQPGRELVLIVGSDTLPELASWREHRRIFSLCSLAVVERPGQPERPAPAEARVTRVRADGLAISATDLRQRVRDGASIRYLVPQPVAEYIRKRGLYR